MIDKDNVKTLFFDYDGTLHNTTEIYIPAFKTVYDYLVKHHGAEEKTWQDQDIARFLGQTPKEMWDQFGLNLTQKAKEKGLKMLSDKLEKAIQNKEAKLYDGALDVLDYLKKQGYKLVFISNCKNYYLEAHKALFNLDQYFDIMVCSETFKNVQAKHKVLAKVLSEVPKEAVIIGDRHHDMTAGKKNGIYTIGARYGFGDHEELKTADMQIDDIKTLKHLF